MIDKQKILHKEKERYDAVVKELQPQIQGNKVITEFSSKILAEKELELSRSKGQLELNKTNTDLAVKNALQQKETTILELESQIKLKNSEHSKPHFQI